MSLYSLSRRPNMGDDINVSFEFFPPNSDKSEQILKETVDRLAPLQPNFVSVTYGAQGSTRERTVRTVKYIADQTKLDVAAHLTCVGSSKSEVDAVIRDFHKIGIRRFVALRGDAPEGVSAPFYSREDGYQNGAELVAGLKAFGNFDIMVSAYPEKHPESSDFATDIDWLKRKVDNGATRAITQFFFDNDTYERYVDRVRRAGIYIPIVPGILPIHNFNKVSHFAKQCQAHIPTWLADRFEGLDDDPQTHALVAASVAAEQVMDLIERGIQDYHFYTMNRAELAFAICHLIGIRPQEKVQSKRLNRFAQTHFQAMRRSLVNFYHGQIFQPIVRLGAFGLRL